MEVCVLFGGGGDAGVDDDDLHAPLPGLFHALGGQVLAVVAVMAPAQEEAGIAHVGGHEGLAGGAAPGHDGGGEAGGGLGAVVHRAEGIGQTLEDGSVPLVVAGVEGHGRGAIFGFDFVEACGDLLVGLVPGDGLELALAPLAHPAQGGEDTVLAVDILTVGLALGAEQTVVGGVAVGALHLDDLAVFHIAGDTAVRAGGTHVAEAVAGDDTGVLAGDLGGEFDVQIAHASVPPSNSVRNSSVKPSRARRPRRAVGRGALFPVNRFMM